MQLKILFSLISASIGIWAFLPYLKNVISKKTKPHVFTWLIWLITQGTAVFGLWLGGGGYGAINLTIGTILTLIILIFALRNGDNRPTLSDIIILTAALLAIVVWLFLDNPKLSIILVSAIDVLGYAPTFKKSYFHPWTETVNSWGYFIIANIFAILALDSYNIMTLTYLLSITLANTSLYIFLITRRRMLKFS